MADAQLRALTPSELVFLSGVPRTTANFDGATRVLLRRFVSPSPRQGMSDLGTWQFLVHGEEWPQFAAAIHDAVAAAFLAKEEASELRLDLADRRVLLGLWTRPAVWAIRMGAGGLPSPAHNGARWPEGTLESALHVEKQGRVSDVVFDWLPRGSPLPYSTVALDLMRVMAQAGALERVLVPGKFLGAFPVKTEHFLLTDAASDLLTRQAAGADCRLLNACRESRPRLLDLLIREIKDGFHRREND